MYIQWNLGSRTPLFTNNSVYKQIFRAKKCRMTNGVSDYEHASWQHWKVGNSGKLRVSARECQSLVTNLVSVYEHFDSRTAPRNELSS
jgi:hypothetical protein